MESSLIGLRAELQKKRVEAAAAAAASNASGQKRVGRPDKEAARPSDFSSSNPGVRERAAKDEEKLLAEQRTQRDAREILEKKAAMYDSINKGIEVLEDDNLNQKFLVNFQKKIVDDVMERKKMKEEKEKLKTEKQKEREEAHPDDYDAKDSDEEWVEYTDAFGRARKCLRAELPQMLEKEKRLSKDLNSSNETEENTAVDPHLLQDLHREVFHKKWEAEEQANASKNDIHYQDVLYDEARTHGTGYLKFSRNESERKAQMELLRDLQTEGKKGKATTAAAAIKREKAMKARLEKVRQRKRLKMGLPMKDEPILKTPPVSEEEEEHEEVDQPPSPKERKKVGGVREWDIGKEGVTSTLTQEEWILRQRSQRDQQFAPPSTYNSRQQVKKQQQQQPRVPSFSQHTSTDNHQESGDSNPTPPPPSPPLAAAEDSFREERSAQFAPPATYEYYGPSASNHRRHRHRPSSDLTAAINKGLSHLRKMSN